MKDNSIKYFIQYFFDNKVSKRTQILFQKWFLQNENTEEKENIMEEICDKSESIITQDTIDDLDRIKKLIFVEKRKTFSLRPIISYAAAIIFLISISSYITYLVTYTNSTQFNQLAVAYGEQKKVTLADGTEVTVNAGSTLIYPEEFNENTRTVFLSGEANFQVAKNKRKPFIVRTKHMDVTALGTKFNVQAYPNSEYTKTALIEGSIKVVVEKEDKNPYILTPDHQLSYSHNNKNISISNIDAKKLESWERGYMIFQDVTFDEIIKSLERKYNIDINYDNKVLQKQSYYVKFSPDESVKDAMDILCLLVHDSSYKIQNSTIYFYNNNP